MKTDDLIGALATDSATRAPVPRRVLVPALLLGLAVATALFFVMLGPRPDIAQAVLSPRFLFKFVATLALALTSVPLVLALARPGARPWLLPLLVAPVLLAGAVLLELALIPSDGWEVRMLGHNARVCMESIPLLSLGPLAALLFVLRAAAPTRPALAGTAAGLAAGALGAMLYAAHCPDDSPLFIAVWYSIAIALVAAVGGLLGSRLLRW